MELLILADDLTGALDTGIQFVDEGANTRVVLDPQYPLEALDPQVQVLVIDTESRHIPPAQADLVRSITEQAVALGVACIYKKTDSGLRGNVGAELGALLDASGSTQLHFIPAYPKTERTTVDGIHYIKGVPVADSVFGQDPFDPVKYSRVADVLHTQTDFTVHSVGLREMAGEQPGIQVYDAVTQEDILNRGLELKKLGRLKVLAGCAGFASVLARLMEITGKRPPLPKAEKAFLLVCGSVNPITRTQVKQAVDAWLAGGGEEPTQFEVITAMGFLYFAQQQVDYAVIEVGMGGLWDSTNVIIPEVSVITNVTLEHTDRLGKTIEAIAIQKAGIIKPGVPVVTEAEGDALRVIRAEAEAQHAPCYEYEKNFSAQMLNSTMAAQEFVFRNPQTELEATIHLAGAHQILNAAAAMQAAWVLAQKDPALTEKAVLEGLAAARWPGRLELIHQKPDIILDGAHNPSGVTVLRKALDDYYPDAHRIFVFGMMADKDVSLVSQILFRDTDTIYTVLAHTGDRAETPEKLAKRLHKNAIPMPDLAAAYHRAVSEAGPEAVVCVCGSLYLVGTFKELGLDR